MPLTTDVQVLLTSNYTSVADLGTPSMPIQKIYRQLLATGTGANQADKQFSDTRTINASSNDDLDLAGTLTDVFGAVLTFVKVKGILVSAAAGNTNNVVIGGASSTFTTWVTGTSPAVLVGPGGTFLLARPDAAGYGVTATSADLLRITNGGAGTSVTYDIVIWGTSA